MKSRFILLAGIAAAGFAAMAAAQDATYPQQTTEQTTGDAQTTTTTKTTTINGSVIKYQPGHTIVIREPDRKVVTYTLTTDSEIPTDITVGKKVTVYTTAGDSGPVVKKVTLTTKTKHSVKTDVR